MKILIINHTTHNKGDNSVLYNLLTGLQSTYNNMDLALSTSDGALPFWFDATGFKSVEVIPWYGGRMYKSPKKPFISNVRRVLRRHLNQKVFFPLVIRSFGISKKLFKMTSRLLDSKFLNQVNAADMVICTGGHHISTVLEKDGLNSQTLAIIISGTFSSCFKMWSQSIGPLPQNKHIRNGLSQSLKDARILVRDNKSMEALAGLGLSDYNLMPDSVFLSQGSKRSEENYVVAAIYTAGISDKSYLRNYKVSWARVIDGLIENYDIDVKFMPMQYKGYGGDERGFIKDIIAISKYPKRVSLLDEDLSPSESLRVFESSKLIIGHKTHSVIYALSSEIPVIALAYHPKTEYFMNLFDFSKFCFNDIIANEEKIINLYNEARSVQRNYHDANALSKRYKVKLTNEIDSWKVEFK